MDDDDAPSSNGAPVYDIDSIMCVKCVYMYMCLIWNKCGHT